MSVTTLFITPGACSFGSIVTLDWIGKPYQVCITNPQIRQSKEFRAINPIGRVGALKDGDTLIYENLAILLYLVDKNQDSQIRIPLNTKERIDTYKWLSYLASTLHTAFSPLFGPAKYIDKDNTSEMEAFKTRMVTNIEGILKFIDAHLSTHEYFIGNNPTIVDAHAYGLLRWTEPVAGIPMSKYPHIEKFMTEMHKLPAVQNALHIEKQEADKIKDSSFAGYFTF